MFRVGEFIVCGTNGICKIVDISKLDFAGSDREYYVLEPVYGKGGRSFLPTDNTKVVARTVINKKEALALIDEIPSIEKISATNDKLREEKYKEFVGSGDCRNLVSVLKTVYSRKQERIAQGKKTTATDDRYFKMAEDNLYSELSFALKKDKDEMEDYIGERIARGAK